MGVDPEKKLGEILGFCNGDKELEDYVLEIASSQFHDHERAVIEGDEKAFETARSIVEELDIAVDFLIDAMNFGRERPLHANGDVPCDINDDESMEIRDYLGTVARTWT